jgi:putative spermidine/putrescine transport system permease protein
VAAVSRHPFHPGPAARTTIGVVVGAFVLAPLAATLEYTFRDEDGHSLTHWAAIVDPARADVLRPLWIGIGNSLVLMAVTVALVLFLLTPTMLLVNLRFPRLRRPFEFVALLPISIPAIVLVVGLTPIYRVIGRTLGTGAWTLALAYGVVVLPFAYRSIQAAIDAVNLTTLAEAARSLGASWPTVAWRVLVPNLRSGLLAASLISVAVVLGEYTIASLLNRQNLQTALILVNQRDGYTSVIFSLLALALCFLLLLIIGRSGQVGQRKGRPS